MTQLELQTSKRVFFVKLSLYGKIITENWLEVGVKGRLCSSPRHWGRNLIRDPPSTPELSLLFDDFEQSFPDGRPLEFSRIACEFAS